MGPLSGPVLSSDSEIIVRNKIIRNISVSMSKSVLMKEPKCSDEIFLIRYYTNPNNYKQLRKIKNEVIWSINESA